ncbi:hypothetical protein DFH09DRAFT_1315391 [Mycena vulgaris]|nr:hypothetical protein DFH09DRAFT_1315391 [Mycena vulgaris]
MSASFAPISWRAPHPASSCAVAALQVGDGGREASPVYGTQEGREYREAEIRGTQNGRDGVGGEIRHCEWRGLEACEEVGDALREMGDV